LAGVRRVTWSGPVVQEITTVKPRCGGNLRESSIALRIDPVMIIAPPLLAAPTFTDYLMIQIRNLTAYVLFSFRLSFLLFPGAHAPILQATSQFVFIGVGTTTFSTAISAVISTALLCDGSKIFSSMPHFPALMAMSALRNVLFKKSQIIFAIVRTRFREYAQA
jgi:hypothetical protein